MIRRCKACNSPLPPGSDPRRQFCDDTCRGRHRRQGSRFRSVDPTPVVSGDVDVHAERQQLLRSLIESIRRDGVVVQGSRGQPRAHPALEVLRRLLVDIERSEGAPPTEDPYDALMRDISGP